MDRPVRPKTRVRASAACVLVGTLAGSMLPTHAGGDGRPPIARQPSSVNLLANSRLTSGVGAEDVAVPQWFSVAAASASSPIVLRTAIPHGLASGDRVVVRDVQGLGRANGHWRVEAVSPTEIALEGSVGTGIWAGGGAIYPTAGQPRPPGPEDAAGNLLWTPWFSLPAAVEPREFFAEGSDEPTGEIRSLPRSRGDAFLSQEVDASLFSPGERLWLSIECRVPEPPAGRQSLKMLVTAVLGTTHTYEASFPAAQMTASYRRFTMAFALDAEPISANGILRVQFFNEVSSGAAAAMLWTRPMLSAGSEAAAWTGDVPAQPRGHSFYSPISP